ncbi:MAG: C69 family dipeptidase [Proteobacteria bacterium]|nr:C69 family dipeptidase [Pseudomonadota bacterium]
MCDSVVATGAHTASGATLFAKNSDRKEGECQPFVQFPAAYHPRGSTVDATHISIPQVAETYRVMGHSPWWIWGFEQGVNEHGVAIGNQTVFSKESVEPEPGLIGMDLVRLGLERGRDARESLEMIAALIETHGQGGAAFAPGEGGYHNSFMIADPEQAWVLETSGRRWAARQVELDALSNQLTLGSDWQIGSRDLESFARSEGWWRSSGRLDVAAAYRNPDALHIARARLERTRELLGSERGRHDVPSLERLLRDHRSGGIAPPADLTAEDPGYFTVCMHAEPVGTTTASLIAPLPTDRTTPWPVWVSFGTPCIGLFVPLYLDGAIPAVLAGGGERFEEDSAWWVFERLRLAAAGDFTRHTPVLREGWSVLEEKIDHERREVEAEARAVAVTGDRDEAGALLTAFMGRTVASTLDRAEELRARIAS